MKFYNRTAELAELREKRPILAKPLSQTIRYEIKDNFLQFWFRYIIKYQGYIQNGMIAQLTDRVKEDYPTYSGLILERYFRAKLREEGRYREIGAWWEKPRNRGGNQNEIDIVAVSPTNETALVAEVKRHRKNFKPEEFERKVEILRAKHLAKTEIVCECLTLDDM